MPNASQGPSYSKESVPRSRKKLVFIFCYEPNYSFLAEVMIENQRLPCWWGWR